MVHQAPFLENHFSLNILDRGPSNNVFLVNEELFMTFRFILLFIGILALNTRAGNISDLEQIGVSEDGKYFAFMSSGIQDGSGFPYVSISILDTAKDKYVYQYSNISKDDHLSLSSLKFFTIIDSSTHLKIYEIKRFTAEEIYTGSLNQENHSEPKYKSKDASLGDIDIVVSEEAVAIDPSFGKNNCDFMKPNLFTLKVFKNKTLLAVYEDTKENALTRCAMNYQVAKAYRYKNDLIVILSSNTIGFEGFNLDHSISIPLKKIL